MEDDLDECFRRERERIRKELIERYEKRLKFVEGAREFWCGETARNWDEQAREQYKQAQILYGVLSDYLRRVKDPDYRVLAAELGVNWGNPDGP